MSKAFSSQIYNQPKSYFEGILKECGGLPRIRTIYVQPGERPHGKPTSVGEKVLMREIVRFEAMSLVNMGATIKCIWLRDKFSTRRKKFTLSEFLSAGGAMRVNAGDVIAMTFADETGTWSRFYRTHEDNHIGGGRIDRWDVTGDLESAKRDFDRALRRHYEERDQFWLKCKTLEEFYAEYPKEIWGDADDNSWFFSLGR